LESGFQTKLKPCTHKKAIWGGIKGSFPIQSICTSTKAGASIAAS
jgi:hypothetical protein